MLEPRNKFKRKKKINAVYTIPRDEQPPAFYIHCVDLMTQTYYWLSPPLVLNSIQLFPAPWGEYFGGYLWIDEINNASTFQCFKETISGKKVQIKLLKVFSLSYWCAMIQEANDSVHQTQQAAQFTRNIFGKVWLKITMKKKKYRTFINYSVPPFFVFWIKHALMTISSARLRNKCLNLFELNTLQSIRIWMFQLELKWQYQKDEVIQEKKTNWMFGNHSELSFW